MGDCDPDDTFQDYSRALGSSQVFELSAGDLLYWPADYWHVGEGDEDLSISFNLDFPVPDEDERTPIAVQRAVDRMVVDSGGREAIPDRPAFAPGHLTKCEPPDVAKRIERSVGRFRELVGSARFEQAVTLEYLRWVTAGGFNRVPERLGGEAITSEAWVWVDPLHPIRAAEVGEVLAIAACGHGLVVPACGRASDLIDELNRGEPKLVSDLVTRYSDQAIAIESVGSISVSAPEATGGFSSLSAGAILWLLDAFVRFRGAFVVDIQGHAEAPVSVPVGAWPVVSERSLRASPETAAQTVLEYGAAWVEGVLDRSACDPLSECVAGLRAQASQADLGSIHANKRRFDLPLPADPMVSDAVAQVLAFLTPTLQRLAGRNPRLVELSALTSFPGAKAQQEHPDSRFGDPDTARMWTVFVSLADISAAMGPLSVWPGTHRSRFYEHEELRREVVSADREVALCVPQGSAVIMDSRTWHRGGANRSSASRPVFYLSFAEEGSLPEGPTYTIHDAFAGRVRLADLLSDR